MNNNQPFQDLLSIIILTKNEAVHIDRALNSALSITRNVVVIDSNSDDGTPTIVKNKGVKLINVNFTSFSEKLNWCIDDMEINTPWVLRLDADEYFEEKTAKLLLGFLHDIDNDVTGIFVKRQIWFLNKFIKYGGLYPNYSIRIWRNRSVICENRELDEHLILKYGRSIKLNIDIIDNPLTTISHWIFKHNGYAISEANTIVKYKNSHEIGQLNTSLFGQSPERKRWFKANLYYNLPLFIRPFIYFLFRYIVRLGFLDGIPGLLYHFYHAFWYRVLIDTIILENQTKLISNEV